MFNGLQPLHPVAFSVLYLLVRTILNFSRRNGDVYSAPGSKSSVGVHTFAVSNVFKKILLLERLGGSDPAAELLASRAETVRPIIRRSDPTLHPCDCKHYDDEQCSIGIH